MTKGDKKKKKTEKKKVESFKPPGFSGLPTPPKPGASTPRKESGKVKVSGKEAHTQKSFQPTRPDKTAQIKKLGRELGKQKAIFKKNAGRAINPDGSEAYWKAKKAFDAADRRIKEIEKELARLHLSKSTQSPVGIKSQPSQSKTKVSPG